MDVDRLATVYHDAVQVIKSEFPALTYGYKEATGLRNLFQLMQRFAKYTKEQLVEQNEMEVAHCYQVANEILFSGTNIAKLAIENVFVFSVSRYLEGSLTAPPSERQLFLKFFKKEYERQISANLP